MEEKMKFTEWMRKLFSHGNKNVQTSASEPEVPPTGSGQAEISEKKDGQLEHPCKQCGKPVYYKAEWKHIPNYCPECKAGFQTQHGDGRIVKKCRKCGKTFSFPATLSHYPNYCRNCQRRFKQREAAR